MGLTVGAALCGVMRAGAAQIPYTVFDEATEVRSVRFVFPETRTFEDAKLELAIALRGRGALYGIRNALGWLPLVPAPTVHRFDPLQLQYDVARLRRFYAESGFLETDVRYDVRYQADKNLVDVDLIITEGRPVVLQSIEVAGAGDVDPGRQLPDELRAGWDDRRTRVETDTGGRFTLERRIRHEREILD